MESALRTAAATYKQQTAIDPPLLHPLPLPNKPIATAYGAADLGAVTARRKVSAAPLTQSGTAQSSESETGGEKEGEVAVVQSVAGQEASVVDATEVTPLVVAAPAQPVAISET